MLKIGLTGGIGAGKSTVAAMFTDRGVPVIDADQIAREVVEPGQPALKEIADVFGPSVIAADGTLDRAALATLAFSSPQSTEDLNNVIHPAIHRRTAELYAELSAEPIVVHDVPLLVETGLSPNYHLAVLVHADSAVRAQRLRETRGMDEADIDARLARQASDEDRFAVVDAIIDNNGTQEQLAAGFDELWDMRIAPFADTLNTAAQAPRTIPGGWALTDQRVRATARERLALRLERFIGKAGGQARVTWADGEFDDGAPLALSAQTTDPEAAAAGLVDAGFLRGAQGEFVNADPGQPAIVRLSGAE